jgi:hypothetical protein
MSASIDRRSLLKHGGAALGVLGLSRVLGPAHAGAQQNPDAPRATIDVEGFKDIGPDVFSLSIDDLEVDTLPTTSAGAAVREMTTGADWDYRTYGPGGTGRLSMALRVSAGTPGAAALRAWVEEARTGTCTPRTVSVVCAFSDGTARTFTFFECYPTSYAEANFDRRSSVACETVVCKMGRVELG